MLGRQKDGKARTALLGVKAATQTYRTAVLFNDAPGNPQAQSSAFTFGGEEWGKNFVAMFAPNTRSVVRNCNSEALVSGLPMP